MSRDDLKYSFDDQLQEVPANHEAMHAHVNAQISHLDKTQDPAQKVKLLGEIGTYLRLLRKLDEAEEYLMQAVHLAEKAFQLRLARAAPQDQIESSRQAIQMTETKLRRR